MVVNILGGGMCFLKSHLAQCCFSPGCIVYFSEKSLYSVISHLAVLQKCECIYFIVKPVFSLLSCFLVYQRFDSNFMLSKRVCFIVTISYRSFNFNLLRQNAIL